MTYLFQQTGDSDASNNFYFDVAAGKITGTSHINKFGFNEGLTSSYEPIWDGSSAYTYNSYAQVLRATSDDAADNTATIEIQGLDSDYNLAYETLTVGGGDGTTKFIRVFRAIMKTHPTDEENQGIITIANDSDVAQAKILETNGQTLMALYTIPAGKTGYLTHFMGTIDKSNDAIFQIRTRIPNGNVFNVKAQFGTFASPVTYEYEVPLVFPEKSDIEIRAKAGATMGGGATFDLVLIDD